MPLDVALTGATGFVGRKVVAELLAGKHRVTALVRDVMEAELPGEVAIVKGDLHDACALLSLTRNRTAVIHIAGVISALRREDYFAVNEMGTKSLMQAARRNGVKRFVHMSSLSAREPHLSPYGASKLAGEAVLGDGDDGLSCMILRPPAVYGPGDRATLPLLNALTKSIAVLPGRADARFSLIHVNDLARIVVEAASSTKTGIVELSDGCAGGHDWRELVRVAAAVEQKSITCVFLPKFIAYAVAYLADAFSKLRDSASMISRDKVNELYHPDWVARGSGWPLKNPIDFAQGLAETLAWYRREGWLSDNRREKIRA
jgi:nucleoside-diphosphate-sugar epimerase